MHISSTCYLTSVHLHLVQLTHLRLNYVDLSSQRIGMIFHQLLLFMQQSLVHLRYYLLSKLSILTATHCRSHVLPILRQLVLLLPSSIEILILLLKKIVIFSLRLVVIVNH